MAKKTAGSPKKALHRSSSETRSAVMRDVNKVLDKHGITGRIEGLHLVAAAADAGGCPPGTSRRVVCRKQPNGTIVCKEECV
jgi:hypothetical protein